MDHKKPRNCIPGFVASVPCVNDSDSFSNVFHSYIPGFKAHERIYTMTNPDQSKRKLVWIGHESRVEDYGCSYAIAVINKKLKTVNFMPTKLITFDGYSDDWEFAVGRKSMEKKDFSVNRAPVEESKEIDRRSLTSEFGSSQRQKALNAREKRLIEDETLQHMVGSTLFDANLSLNESLNDLSDCLKIMKPAQSTVLPQAKLDAKKPGDIYPLDIFISEEDVEKFLPKVSKFLQKTKSELIEIGLSQLVCNFLDQSKDEKESVYAFFLGVMVAFYRIIAAPGRRHITHEEWMSINCPLEMKKRVSELFFPGGFKKETVRSKLHKCFLSQKDKDKMLAHILCLAIMLDSQSYILPITPWVSVLLTQEPKIVRIVTALGCTMIAATPEEAMRLETIRIAKLVRPPGQLKSKYWRARRKYTFD